MVEWGRYQEAYKAIHNKLDEILTKLDYPTDPAIQDVIDRADRLLGKVYGSEGVVLLQRAATHELKVQLCHQGTEYQAGGGAGGLVQCQIRNAANDAWINEPFARRIQGSQGQDLLQRGTTYDLIVQLRHAGIEIDPRDRTWTITEALNVSDRAARLLGIIYGDQGQLLQRATTRDLLIQIRHSGTEIDPRNIRALTSSDVVDISDRAARDLGKIDIAGFDVSLPAGTNTIGSVNVTREGAPSRINTTSSGQIVAAPGAGYKLVLCGFVVSVDADEKVRLRWNGGTGPIIATLPTKGVIGMNLVGVNEASGENQNLYLEKTGSGNAQGTVWTKTVAV